LLVQFGSRALNLDRRETVKILLNEYFRKKFQTFLIVFILLFLDVPLMSWSKKTSPDPAKFTTDPGLTEDVCHLVKTKKRRLEVFI